MRGSLENPPIVVRESWLSRYGTLLILAFIIVIFAGVPDSMAWHTQPVLSAVLVVSGCFVAGWRFIRPSRLEIWPRELVWIDIFGIRHHYAFADIAEFAVVREQHGWWRIGFNWTEDSPRRTRLSRVAEFVDGNDGSIGGSWEMSTDAVVDLLNRTRLLPSAWR